jgi:glycosyltransferase involved in cell wall biosynthesis
MKLLIVGNGSTGVEGKKGLYINNRTGDFVKNIKAKFQVGFSQSTTVYNKNNNLQNYNLLEHGIPFEEIPRKKSMQYVNAVKKAVKAYDFIYMFYPGTLGKVYALICILMKKPYGFYIRGQYYNQSALDRIVLKRTKFILTISPSFVPDLQRFCKKVGVIKPMIDIETSDLNKDRKFFKKEQLDLLFVGRVEERKGINELVEIAKYLKQDGYHFKLNVVGGGDMFENVNALLKRDNLQNDVILHGLVSDKMELKAFYDNADAFVFTSHDEGFPRVLYESMASALPIFTTFVGGISGRMTDMENCVEIPVKQAKDAAVIISKHLKNVQLLEKIGKNGQQTLEDIIDGSHKTHEELLLNYINNEE